MPFSWRSWLDREDNENLLWRNSKGFSMPLLASNPQKALSELSDREVLALAIQAEEEDGRVYREFAEGLREHYPASAQVFMNMAEEESRHRRQLLDLFEQRFGDHIPLIRRED